MYQFDFQKRVRYAETDKMGYLYYGNYPKYFEIGRVETIRSLGVDYKDFEDVHKIMLPVVQLESKYLLPAYYDDLLTIKSYIKELPSKMITFHHEILNPSGKVINKAVVKLFFIDMVLNKRTSAPKFMVEKLKSYFD